MDVVLDRYGSKDLKDALVKEGFVDLFQVLTIDDVDIECLVYQNPADPSKTIPIRKGDVGMLKCFKAFVHHRSALGNPIQDTDWISLTQAEFDSFRIHPICFEFLQPLQVQRTLLAVLNMPQLISFAVV
jgi:hypothetical protein